MLPAMNLDDRAELLGGMRAGAPAEVFQGCGAWPAPSVLAPADHAALEISWTCPDLGFGKGSISSASRRQAAPKG